MALKDIYEKWTFKPLAGVGAGDTPIKQSEGRVDIDFLPNNYQTGVTNRTPGNKVVTQATEDNKTNGKFTDQALGYYTRLYQSPARLFKSKVVHLYDAQGTDTSKYVSSAEIRNTQGALYSTNL